MTLADRVAPHLPYLRRYARALTGAQDSGDAYVVATLEVLISDPASFPDDIDPRTGLYGVFHRIWGSCLTELPLSAVAEDRRAGVARRRLDRLTPISRQALLLTAMEGFAPSEAAGILGLATDETSQLIAQAVAEIEQQIRTDVLIIEDEPIIAMDLEGIVTGLGHAVAAMADTRDAAVKAAMEHSPGLILADIQLADGSSGVDAVKDILDSFDVPVIFITAYPDRLLTGERPEPTYLITKPFESDTVRAAISQALFFESSARMRVPD